MQHFGLDQRYEIPRNIGFINERGQFVELRNLLIFTREEFNNIMEPRRDLTGGERGDQVVNEYRLYHCGLNKFLRQYCHAPPELLNTPGVIGVMRSRQNDFFEELSNILAYESPRMEDWVLEFFDDEVYYDSENDLILTRESNRPIFLENAIDPTRYDHLHWLREPAISFMVAGEDPMLNFIHTQMKEKFFLRD